jgi:hypothetical protein
MCDDDDDDDNNNNNNNNNNNKQPFVMSIFNGNYILFAFHAAVTQISSTWAGERPQ